MREKLLIFGLLAGLLVGVLVGPGPGSLLAIVVGVVGLFVPNEWHWEMNPFRCKAEGWRRLSLVLSGIALVAWWAWLPWWAEESRSRPSVWGWIIALTVPPLLAYAVIMLLRWIWLWVAGGFRGDADARQTRHSDAPRPQQDPRQG